jgi:hypothetical protein
MAEVNQAQAKRTPLEIENITPASDVTAGTPTDQGGRAANPNNDLETGREGSGIQVRGLIKVVKADTEVISEGVAIWWDSDGNPQGGTAGTGAATATQQAAAEGFLLGAAREGGATAADNTVTVDLNGKVKGAAIAAAAGTDAALIDAITQVLRDNGLIANA